VPLTFDNVWEALVILIIQGVLDEFVMHAELESDVVALFTLASLARFDHDFLWTHRPEASLRLVYHQVALIEPIRQLYIEFFLFSSPLASLLEIDFY